MRALSAWLGAIALICVFAPVANATAIYSFAGNIGAPGGGVYSIGITVTDAIANGGSFNFHVVGAGSGCDPAAPLNCIITGDPTGFVSLTESRGETFSFPSHILGTLNLAFTVSGGVAGGSVTMLGALTDLNASFGPAGLSGTVGGDGLPCFGTRRCPLTPFVSAVPEPSTFALFLAAIAILFAGISSGRVGCRRS
jgi:hypothetical protein